MADGDASLGEQIFDIAVTQIESIVELDGITDDIGWEPVALISIHLAIIKYRQFS